METAHPAGALTTGAKTATRVLTAGAKRGMAGSSPQTRGMAGRRP